MNITFADEATGEERLRQLLRVVEAAPDERFDMRDFHRETRCGTAYCAAGWAALDPWFRENTPIGEVLGVISRTDGGRTLEVMTPGCAFDSLADIFGLDRNDAVILFGATLNRWDVVDKCEVVENIRSLLGGGPVNDYTDYNDSDEDEDL
jgi:hypothetical protein